MRCWKLYNPETGMYTYTRWSESKAGKCYSSKGHAMKAAKANVGKKLELIEYEMVEVNRTVCDV